MPLPPLLHQRPSHDEIERIVLSEVLLFTKRLRVIPLRRVKERMAAGFERRLSKLIRSSPIPYRKLAQMAVSRISKQTPEDAIANSVVMEWASSEQGGKFVEKLTISLSNELANATEHAIDDLSKFYRLDFANWKLPREEAIAFLRAAAGKRIKGVTDNILNTISETLSDGLSRGYGVPKLAQMLRSQLGDVISRKRAKVIAQTETAFAFGYAQEVLARKVGAEQKRWITAKDDKVCPICLSNQDIGAVAVDDDFPGGVKWTPQHPMCRCDTVLEGLPKGPEDFYTRTDDELVTQIILNATSKENAEMNLQNNYGDWATDIVRGVRWWSEDGYTYIRSQSEHLLLGKPKPVHYYAKWAQYLAGWLVKLAHVAPQVNIPLYRGIALTDRELKNFLDTMRLDNVVSFAVTSWSASPNTASRFALSNPRKVPIVLELVGDKRALNISRVSGFPNEQEHILMGKLRVAGIHDAVIDDGMRRSKGYRIQLEYEGMLDIPPELKGKKVKKAMPRKPQPEPEPQSPYVPPKLSEDPYGAFTFDFLRAYRKLVAEGKIDPNSPIRIVSSRELTPEELEELIKE